MAAETRSRAALRAEIGALLREPEWQQRSNRAIAERLRCDKNTVAATRAKLMAGGEVTTSDRLVGRDGKAYAAGSLDVRLERNARDRPKMPARFFWTCPLCGTDYTRRGAEAAGWVKRCFCGVCAGEAEDGGGS